VSPGSQRGEGTLSGGWGGRHVRPAAVTVCRCDKQRHSGSNVALDLEGTGMSDKEAGRLAEVLGQ
jgi:hypothetical protein